MSNKHRQGLIAAYRKLMVPLVRILLKNGISFNEFAEVLKNVFVEVAKRDLCLMGRESSQARVAILTGLTRKEVARQELLLADGDLIETSNLNRVTRVLEAWHTDSDFTGAYGLPIELPFGKSTGAPSFTALVEKYSLDMAPEAMLEELLRTRAAETLSSGHIRVLMRAYIPQSLHPDALERLGAVVKNFVSSYEYNMEHNAAGTARFERVVYADNGLSLDLMPAFEALLRVKGQQLLVELDNWLTAQELTEGDDQNARARVKTGVGIYHFVEDDE